MRREAVGRHGAVQSVVGERTNLGDVHNCINILGERKIWLVTLHGSGVVSQLVSVRRIGGYMYKTLHVEGF